ncbi:hypothetical protein [Sphingomonas bacterium]|uniref:hypothetical protein n=1 Tax=Sphingomonas bacterium TaxID=1895847 RepID=UPI00261EE2B7|nr:hypothetical protein [Sphingomonas bacterium]MDB5677350.1 peptidase [Sphingomonas bacterium]
MRLTLAVAALLVTTAAAPAAQPMHAYAGLALSPAGDMLASVETADTDSGKPAHGKIVVRSVKDGHILTTIDPCATCSYSGLTFGPGFRLAWLQRDRAKGTTQLWWAAGNG